MRFRTRLTLVLLTVVIVSQLAIGVAFLRATQNDALAKGSQRLEVGARVLNQLLIFVASNCVIMCPFWRTILALKAQWPRRTLPLFTQCLPITGIALRPIW